MVPTCPVFGQAQGEDLRMGRGTVRGSDEIQTGGNDTVGCIKNDCRERSACFVVYIASGEMDGETHPFIDVFQGRVASREFCGYPVG
jgi:hypothetical protein